MQTGADVMASLEQVRTAICNFIEGAVYPDGLSQPSVAGVDIEIAPLWPPPNYLERVFAAGKAHVSVWEPPGTEKKTTLSFPEEIVTSTNTATLIMTVGNPTITLSGTITAGEIAVVVINKNSGSSYSYTVEVGDTLDTIASALAALIPGAAVVGTVITISSAWNIIARVSVITNIQKNLKRQKRLFWIVNWSPTIAIRNSISDAIDVALPETPYIPLDTLYSGRILYENHHSLGYLEKQKCYRDDFWISVDWETTTNKTYYTIENIYTPITSSAS
jgi:hypothetical protein